MICRVKLFARARELAESDVLSVELPDNATVGTLRQVLTQEHPKLAGLLTRSALAVDNDFADDATPLSNDSEVALIPPVSGG